MHYVSFSRAIVYRYRVKRRKKGEKKERHTRVDVNHGELQVEWYSSEESNVSKTPNVSPSLSSLNSFQFHLVSRDNSIFNPLYDHWLGYVYIITCISILIGIHASIEIQTRCLNFDVTSPPGWDRIQFDGVPCRIGTYRHDCLAWLKKPIETRKWLKVDKRKSQ